MVPTSTFTGCRNPKTHLYWVVIPIFTITIIFKSCENPLIHLYWVVIPFSTFTGCRTLPPKHFMMYNIPIVNFTEQNSPYHNYRQGLCQNRPPVVTLHFLYIDMKLITLWSVSCLSPDTDTQVYNFFYDGFPKKCINISDWLYYFDIHGFEFAEY